MWKAMVVGFRIALAMVALAVAGGPAVTTAQATPSGRDKARATALAADVLAELNSLRAKRGLVALRVSPGLAAAAAHHSREMSQNGYFDHRSADGSAFSKRVARFYPSGRSPWSVGENLLWASPDIDAPGALRMWMESPEHRKNMLDPSWREVGISALHVTAAPGYYKGLEVTIVTTNFGVRG
jgi:uncharacterized protein YkwD